MREASRYKLGAFVAVAVLLIILSFFLVGLSELFEPKLTVLTVFRDSVEGLKVGSPVKYKGVSFGRVTRIAMQNQTGYIDVFMVIYSSSMDSIDPKTKRISQSRTNSSLFYYFNNLKEQGMRCSLQSSGITGGAFIELDDRKHATKQNLPEIEVSVPEDVVYIPSRPSHVSAVIENISKTAEELAKINITGLAAQFKSTMARLDTKLAELKITEVTNKLTATLDLLNTRLKDPKLIDFIDKMDKISGKLEEGLDKFGKTFTAKKIDDLILDISKCIKALTELAGNVEDKMQTISELRRQLTATMSNLNETLDAATELCTDISENPTSLIRGKAQKQIFPDKKK